MRKEREKKEMQFCKGIQVLRINRDELIIIKTEAGFSYSLLFFKKCLKYVTR